MNEKCFIKNPLVRDGTSQAQRLLETLLPAYVAVDERSMKDLAEFASKFAVEIQFFQNNNTPLGDWTDFFNIANGNWEEFSLEEYLSELKVDQVTDPHLALFFGFLYMFKVAQEDMNTITQRHLDFYYRDVLLLEEKAAVPDQVIVIFNLAKHVNTHLIKKGTILKAGKDDTGVELYYKVAEDVAINKTMVSELKAIYVDKQNDNQLFASPVANSADGKGADIKNEELSWKTFGKPTDEAGRDLAMVGFAFASPVLHLAEGKRTVTLRLKTTKSIQKLKLSHDSLKVYFSGEKEWIEADSCELVDPVSTFKKKLGKLGFKTKETDTNELIIRANLIADQDPVVSYDKEALSEPYDTSYPVIKIVLNQETPDPEVYKNLKQLSFIQANIEVSVEGVKNLVLQNDQAVLDANKPFLPFSNRPHKGSNFYVGSWEVFQKELTELKLNVVWNELPEGATGFKGYYANYHDHTETKYTEVSDIEKELDEFEFRARADKGAASKKRRGYLVVAEKGTEPIRDNEDFKIEVSVLDKKNWKTIDSFGKNKDDRTDITNLFTNSTGQKIANGGPLPEVDAKSLIKIPDPNLNREVMEDDDLEQFSELTNDTKKGFIRLKLLCEDFGHAVFSKSFSKQSIALATWDKTGDEPQLPNEPYTPAIKEFSLDYSSEAVIVLDKNTKQSTLEQRFLLGPRRRNPLELIGETAVSKGKVEFFHVHPFGVQKLTTTSSQAKLLPTYDNEGNLYIGLSNLEPPQTLSILLQHAEGSADPDANKQDIVWKYLKKDGEWGLLKKDTHILSDGTNDLLTSGIILFDIPEDISKENTMLTDGKHWLGASVGTDSDAICDLIDVKAQAVSAMFSDQGNDPDHLRTTLEAETISKLLRSDAAVDKVTQPYASFGGQIEEQRPEFYTRISERLRHKHRAITIWDYERLILQQFPEVYKVKCINHTRFTGTFADYTEMIPGHVTLIIISNVYNKNAVDPLRPKTSLATLDEIETYINSIKLPCVSIHVRNPVYEEVAVDFQVKFNKGIDTGLFKVKLLGEIKDFLSPWASDCPEDIRFGGRIHKSMILNFIEERSYVDFVTCFKMYHIVPLDESHNDGEDVEEAIATTAVSILGSADDHTINVIPVDSDSCECDDNIVLNSLQLASADDCPCEEEEVPDDDQPIVDIPVL